MFLFIFPPYKIKKIIYYNHASARPNNAKSLNISQLRKLFIKRENFPANLQKKLNNNEYSIIIAQNIHCADTY